MRDMGRAMMGTGEAAGEGRAMKAAEAAIANPLLDEASMKGAKGVLVSISGGMDMTLFEVDEAATRIREEVYDDADIIVGAIFDKQLEGKFRVSVVATGLDQPDATSPIPQSDPRCRASGWSPECFNSGGQSPAAASHRGSGISRQCRGALRHFGSSSGRPCLVPT